uniref:Uncharacterized protein n=1 Tax=Auxenochlorella protothecoides TaxID=3075 RepID=A0A1D2AGC6_AUXPR
MPQADPSPTPACRHRQGPAADPVQHQAHLQRRPGLLQEDSAVGGRQGPVQGHVIPDGGPDVLPRHLLRRLCRVQGITLQAARWQHEGPDRHGPVQGRGPDGAGGLPNRGAHRLLQIAAPGADHPDEVRPQLQAPLHQPAAMRARLPGPQRGQGPLPGLGHHRAAECPRQRRLPGLLRRAQAQVCRAPGDRGAGPEHAAHHGGGGCGRHALLAGHLPTGRDQERHDDRLHGEGRAAVPHHGRHRPRALGRGRGGPLPARPVAVPHARRARKRGHAGHCQQGAGHAGGVNFDGRWSPDLHDRLPEACAASRGQLRPPTPLE